MDWKLCDLKSSSGELVLLSIWSRSDRWLFDVPCTV